MWEVVPPGPTFPIDVFLLDHARLWNHTTRYDTTPYWTVWMSTSPVFQHRWSTHSLHYRGMIPTKGTWSSFQSTWLEDLPDIYWMVLEGEIYVIRVLRSMWQIRTLCTITWLLCKLTGKCGYLNVLKWRFSLFKTFIFQTPFNTIVPSVMPFL